MLAYRLNDRPVLLIGGGNVASGRLFFLLESGAKVTVISPEPLDPSIRYRLKTNPDDVTYLPREYKGREDDVKVGDFAMVMTAIDNNELSIEVYKMCREVNVPCNVADVPPYCDFYFGAQLRRGPLQVMVSTGGMGPRIGAMIRNIILKALPDNLEESIKGVGALRGDLRKRAPGVGGPLGQRRMDWMIGICDEWGMAKMAEFNDEGLRKKVLDEGWDKEKIIKPSDMGVGYNWDGVKQVLTSTWAVSLGTLTSGLAIGSIATAYYLRSGARR
jgi:precorrin-2 dehydrogenase/sirohydrochlorin ferrochelatase